MPFNIDRKVAGDLLVVSSAAQADGTTPATLTKLLGWDEESTLNIERDSETNEGEKTGQVEATSVDTKGRKAAGKLSTKKAQPDHIAWALRMLLGAATSSALGVGFKHVFKMSAYPTNPPYFTAAHRKGGASALSNPADFARQRGLAIAQSELNAQKGEFLALNLTVVGLGYLDDGIVHEVFTPTFTAGTATVTLTADPEGATDGARADRIQAFVDGTGVGYHELPLTIVSYVAATNVLTVSSGSLSGAHSVRVSYYRTATVDTWKTDVLAAVGQTEYKMKAANMRLYLGGEIDTSLATPTLTGGQYGECEIDDFKWDFNWNAEASSCWATTDPPDEVGYAQQVETGDVVQRITVNRGVRDWLMKQLLDLDKPFGISIWSKGPEWEAGNRYFVQLFFPYCKVLTPKQEAQDGKWRDNLEIAVLKDPGIAAGGLQDNQVTVAAIIQNMVATYA